MSAQLEMQAIGESQAPRKRRVRNIPDALGDQYLKSSRDQDAAVHSKIALEGPEDIYQDLAMLTTKLDAAVSSFVVYALTELDHDEYGIKDILPHVFPRLDDYIEYTRRRLEYLLTATINGWTDPWSSMRVASHVKLWGEFEALSRVALIRNGSQPDLKTMNVINDVARTIESSARLIPEVLTEAVACKPLDPQIKSLMRRRWNGIDTFLEAYHHATGTSRGKDIPTWPVLANIIQSNSITFDRSSHARLNRISSSLWLILLAFLVTIPTTALAWQYSLHKPGIPKDADFWFQIQDSCMTILNFAILAIPIWRNEALAARMSFWIWGLLISASLCVASAPIVYLFGPTEWSSFMSIAAGIVQAFITLQIALVADTAANAGTKNVKED